MNMDLAFGIFAFITVYAYPIIGGGWAYVRLLRICWRDVRRAFRAHSRKQQQRSLGAAF